MRLTDDIENLLPVKRGVVQLEDLLTTELTAIETGKRDDLQCEGMLKEVSD